MKKDAGEFDVTTKPHIFEIAWETVNKVGGIHSRL